jgi:hypothetical protein
VVEHEYQDFARYKAQVEDDEGEGVFCLTEEEYEKLREGPCTFCHRPGLGGIDRIIGASDKSEKGEYKVGNCVPACSDCNHTRGTETVEAFLERSWRIKAVWADCSVETVRERIAAIDPAVAAGTEPTEPALILRRDPASGEAIMPPSGVPRAVPVFSLPGSYVLEPAEAVFVNCLKALLRGGIPQFRVHETESCAAGRRPSIVSAWTTVANVVELEGVVNVCRRCFGDDVLLPGRASAAGAGAAPVPDDAYENADEDEGCDEDGDGGRSGRGGGGRGGGGRVGGGRGGGGGDDDDDGGGRGGGRGGGGRGGGGRGGGGRGGGGRGGGDDHVIAADDDDDDDEDEDDATTLDLLQRSRRGLVRE